jgi:hypothetical protein
MTTPEPLVSTLARKFRVDVNTGTAAAPAWTQVRAISSLSPSIDSNMEDDSDYDSDGWGSSVKTAMSWSLEMTLLRKVTVEGRAYDPGQEAIRVAADAFGPDSVVHVRWYDREGGPEAYSGYASVEWSPEGGEYTALDSASATLHGQGARTVITNPAPSTDLATVASASPSSGPAAGGDLVVLTGTNFIGTTGVTFDGAAAPQVEIVSSTKLSVVTPAGVAGAADVVVTTAAGASAPAAVYTYV